MASDSTYRIMVVDDDPQIRMVIEAALSDKYEVAHAHDGLDALEKIDRYDPDFVIMDIMMPLMSGFEACQAIRNNPQYQNIQVLFLSAYDSRDEIAKSYQAGGNLFLSKPIDPDRLLRNVDLFFEKRPIPPRPKRMSIKQIKLLEKVEKKPTPAPAPEVPRRAMAPQAGPRVQHKPLERLEAPKAPSARATIGAGSTLLPRILVVEDDKGLSDLISMTLGELFEIMVAHDGLEAVEKIVKYQPDILLVDVMLPKMNGYQLCQSVRANRAFSKTPIVFITAKSSAKERDYALKVGGDDFLAKPFEMDDLTNLCRNIVKKPDFHVRRKSLSAVEIRAFEKRESTPPPTFRQPFDKKGRIE